MEIFLVGGAVRDTLLDYPFKDRDWVVVGASAEEMLEQKFQQVGKDFPVFIHPQTKEECNASVTSARGLDSASVTIAADADDGTKCAIKVEANAISAEEYINAFRLLAPLVSRPTE